MKKLTFNQLSEEAKKQAIATYKDYEQGEYMVMGDVIIMRMMSDTL